MTLTNPYDQLCSPILTNCGLNMQATFRLTELPKQLADTVLALLNKGESGGSLMLLGNGGRTFWENLPEVAWQQQHPLDQHSGQCADEYMRVSFPGLEYRLLYPGELPLGLQRFGVMAGWHCDSPLKLGINPVFGLWYAYRALLWVDGDLPITKPVEFDSPCIACSDKPCINACPVDALSGDVKRLDTCIDYRLMHDSPCQSTCLARVCCPIAKQHQYSEQQLNYHYQQSYNTLLSWRS